MAADRKTRSPLSLTWTHNLDPMKIVCPYELHGHCANTKCENEHLRPIESRTGHALDCVDRVQSFFEEGHAKSLEKDIVRSKLSVYSGKNLDVTVASLISAFNAIPNKLPLASRSVKVST